MQEHLSRPGRLQERELLPAERDQRFTPVSRSDQHEDPHDADEHERPNMAADYYRTIMRHRTLIVGLAFVGLLAGLLLHLNTQPVYETRTSLEIQSMNNDFMDNRSVAPTAALPSDAVVQTQMKLLGSDSLTERVKLQLSEEGHPSSVMRNDLLSRMQRGLHISAGQTIPFDDLVDETAKGIKIKPMGISQLVEVTCDSWDPAFAADFCNTLVGQFQTLDMESRGDQAKRISDWLVRQAADVRLKAEESQHRLEQATGGNGLMLNPQTDSVGEDHLRQMQTELVRAQADRMQKQAELAEAQSSGATGPDTEAYSASKLRLADLQAQVAALMPPLTEANPKIIHLRAQIAEVQQNMVREKALGNSKLQEAYQAAKHREDLLSLSYRQIEGSVSSDLQKSSEVDLLRREMQSEQQLYQTLMQRAKEAGFASAMPASTIRVVDPARKPKFAVYPKRITTALIGGLLGIIVGVLVAFVIERQMPRLRLPGDVSRFIRIDELGVIPSTAIQQSAVAPKASKLLSPVQHALVRFNGTDASEAAQKTNQTWSEETLVAESYRNATLSLLLAEPDKNSRTFVVSSPNAGEGKTTVTSNLGIALSKSKLRVVLVDGDLRKPRLHDVMSVDNQHGLRDLLRDGVSAYSGSMETVCKPTAYNNLFVIPAGHGKESIADLLHSPQLQVLMDDLASRFDVILVDSPPMLHIADARILAGYASQAILVFRSGVTKRSNAVTVRKMLQRDRVRIAGSVLNDFDPRREGQRRYYNGYYAYSGEAAAYEAKAS